MSEISKIITPAECYWLPVNRWTGRPPRRSEVAIEASTRTLRNLRTFSQWMTVPETEDELTLRRLALTVRSGDGMTGRPRLADEVRLKGADVSIVKEETAELNAMAKQAPADLWLTFADESFYRKGMLPMARFLGVVINTEVDGLGPRYQPEVQTTLGERTLVPNTYQQGWLHAED